MSEAQTTSAVAERLQRYVRGGVSIPEALRQPRPDRYAMYPLHVAPDGSFCIASAVWGVGQRTPIHDHLTWGVVGVVEGLEEEVHYTVSRSGAPHEIRRTTHRPGDVVVCCTADDDVHEVACVSDVPVVALHVYGVDIGRQPRHTFDAVTGTRSDFISAWTEPK